MKCLYLIPELSVGGAERQLCILARGLQAEGHTVRILALHRPQRPLPVAADLDVRVHDAPPPHDPRCLALFLREIRSFRPDVLHTFLFGFDFWANLAARLLRVPCVVSSRRELAGWQTRRHRAWQNAGNLLVDAVVANSVAAAEYSYAMERFLDRGRVYAVPNIYEPRPAPVSSPPIPDTDGFCIVNIANFWPSKGQDVFVRAFCRFREVVPHSCLWLVGDGPRRPSVEALVQELALGGCVRLLGRRHDIDRILARASLYTHASGSELSESSPNAILEAMGAGVPVVATATGGVPELLEGGALGCLVDPDDEDALVHGLLHAHANPALLREMAARALAAVRTRHAPSAVVRRTAALYERLATERRSGAPRRQGRGRRLSIYAIGDGNVPSTRFRIFQYVPVLQEVGYLVRVFVLRSPGPGRLRQFTGLIRQAIVRRLQMRHWRQADVVLIQKGLTACRWRWPASAALRRQPRFMFDFDDAVHGAWPIRLPGLLRKCQDENEPTVLMRNAAHVIAGNATLAAYARTLSARVSVIPTVVDTSRYWYGERPERPRLTIGWSGSASTNIYLAMVFPVLRRLAATHDFDLLIMSDRRVTLDPPEKAGLPYRFIPWSRDGEVAVLRRFDIGLMPLPDNAWERGKCGLKALLYMALGAVPVCSPVGVNREIVEDGTNGFLAADDTQWYQKLKILLEDHSLRAVMSRNARATVEQRFSVTANADKLAHVLGPQGEAGGDPHPAAGEAAVS